MTTLPLQPEAFFTTIIKLQDKLEINRVCNELIDQLTANYKPSTVSSKLSAYKKPFRGYKHENSDLNETVQTKDGEIIQHIAYRLLNLPTEQLEELKKQREDNDNQRAGFKTDGTLKQVDKPQIDMAQIITKAEKLIISNRIQDIAFGILLVTGLRANEVCMRVRNYDDYDIIEREMVETTNGVIAFKGISKTHGDRRNEYFIRPTLIDASRVVEAQNRLYKLTDAKGFNGDFNKYYDSIGSHLARDFKKLFPELATLKAYDEETGKVARNDSSTHRARAFYACTIRAILKDNMSFNDKAAKTYIKECLGHDSLIHTSTYLDKFDDSEFINTPLVNLPRSIKEIGIQVDGIEAIEKPAIPLVTEERKEFKSDFSIDKILSIISSDLRLEYGKILAKCNDVNIALAKLITQLEEKAQEKAQEKIEKLEATIAARDEQIAKLEIMKDKKVAEPKIKEPKKPNKKSKPIENRISKIFQAINIYNNQQQDPEQFIFPSIGFVSATHKELSGTEVGKATYKKYADNLLNGSIDNLQLQGLTLEYMQEIKFIKNDETYNKALERWNSKFHRTSTEQNAKAIVDIVNSLAD